VRRRWGNVSQACREFGTSRTLFYRWRPRDLACGPDGVDPGELVYRTRSTRRTQERRQRLAAAGSGGECAEDPRRRRQISLPV